MPKDKTSSVKQLLYTQQGDLAGLIQRSRQLADLDELVRTHLGEPIGAHVRVANLNQRSLVLQADSPTWATRIRYQIPGIIRFLAQSLPGDPPRDARVITRPPLSRPTPRHDSRRTELPAAAAALFRSLAERPEAPDGHDADFRAALLRLASNSDRRRQS